MTRRRSRFMPARDTLGEGRLTFCSGSMFAGKPWNELIRQYGTSHQHPVNRLCHTFGIPLIAASLPLFVVAIFVHRFWPIPAAMFVMGWTLQFIGHAFEGKPPEFFHRSEERRVGKECRSR